jgi:hypothetical protein
LATIAEEGPRRKAPGDGSIRFGRGITESSAAEPGGGDPAAHAASVPRTHAAAIARKRGHAAVRRPEGEAGTVREPAACFTGSKR